MDPKIVLIKKYPGQKYGSKNFDSHNFMVLQKFWGKKIRCKIFLVTTNFGVKFFVCLGSINFKFLTDNF